MTVPDPIEVGAGLADLEVALSFLIFFRCFILLFLVAGKGFPLFSQVFRWFCSFSLLIFAEGLNFHCFHIFSLLVFVPAKVFRCFRSCSLLVICAFVSYFVFFAVLFYLFSRRVGFVCVCVTPPLPTEGARPDCITASQPAREPASQPASQYWVRSDFFVY